MADQQIIKPSAGLKPSPVAGGPNVCVVAQGDRVTVLDDWREVLVTSGASAGKQGWLHSAAIGDIPPPPPPPPPPNPSGIAMPGALPGWQQVFSDDFDVDAPSGSFPDQKRWGCDVGWNDTSGHGTYDPTILSVSGHCLRMHIHATTDAAGKVTYHVAAPFPIINPVAKQPVGRNFGAGTTYARIDVCARIDHLPGYKTAWLFWPTDNLRVPNVSIPSALHGEIDWPEGPCDGGPRAISAYMHHMDSTSNNDQEFRRTNNLDRTKWHVYSTVWAADGVSFLLDGVAIGPPITTRIPSTPMHYKMQTECLIIAATPDPAVSGYVEFDWVAVYTPAS